MSVTEFKATCLGVIDKVQKEKSRVTITRHGKPAAELIPISASSPGKLFGRSKESTVAEKIRGFSGTAIVSAISQWEVSTLAMKGRLNLMPDEESWFSANLESPVSLAPLTAEISLAGCRLPDFHADPADRIIVSTAITLGIPLITADEKIIRWNEEKRLVLLIPFGREC